MNSSSSLAPSSLTVSDHVKSEDHLGHRAAELGKVCTNHLSGVEKAAIVVRALAEVAELSLSDLPRGMQTELTQTLTRMQLIDRKTMYAVLEEFIETLDQVGLSFPDSIEGALSILEPKLDQSVARHLRLLGKGRDLEDVWAVLEVAEDATLLSILARESEMIGAVMLSKLSTDKAAGLLMQLESDLAQELALAIARTEAIAPEAVRRIGMALADEVRTKPISAFIDPPSKRMGNILNSSSPVIRDGLLAHLDDLNHEFAQKVRRSIFTFKDIASRLDAMDVPRLMRDISPDDITIVIAAQDPEDSSSISFLLENMSKRAASTLKDDAATLPSPTAEARVEACSRIAATIRKLVDADEVRLKPLSE